MIWSRWPSRSRATAGTLMPSAAPVGAVVWNPCGILAKIDGTLARLSFWPWSQSSYPPTHPPSLPPSLPPPEDDAHQIPAAWLGCSPAIFEVGAIVHRVGGPLRGSAGDGDSENRTMAGEHHHRFLHQQGADEHHRDCHGRGGELSAPSLGPRVPIQRYQRTVFSRPLRKPSEGLQPKSLVILLASMA